MLNILSCSYLDLNIFFGEVSIETSIHFLKAVVRILYIFCVSPLSDM